MSKTKLQLIIENLEKMDLSMLDVLLDENKTYQDARKEVFLKKIEEIFSKLKAKGDTRLESFKGFCNSNECSNKGCKGYSFVGNKSKSHIDLIFEETGADVNDIYDCFGFETLDDTVQRENILSIVIKKDEEATFKPSVDYLIKSQKCNFAYEELYKYKNVILSKDIYLLWLEKHNALYKTFTLPPIMHAQYGRFYWLYSHMDDLKEYLQSDESAKKAVNEFEKIKVGNETQLLAWLVKYEKTGHDLTLFMYNDINFEYPEEKSYFVFEALKISTSDFKYIAKFKFLFDKHYWDMLEKYTTFSEEEKHQYINQNSEMANHISSLSYHLEKRGLKIEVS